MPSIDPYVAAPSETRPRARLEGARFLLGSLIVILLIAATVTVGLVNARQDPSLQIPLDQQTDGQVDGDGGIPIAPPLGTDQ